MFYLYHIKGVKWGCTKRLEQRLKSQGYSISDIEKIIKVDDIELADKLERKLNDEYGYTNQHQSYIKTLAKSVKGGKSNKQATSILLKHRHKGPKASLESKKHNSKQKYTCPHCNKIGYGLPMLRWHMDNCKLKTS